VRESLVDGDLLLLRRLVVVVALLVELGLLLEVGRQLIRQLLHFGAVVVGIGLVVDHGGTLADALCGTVAGRIYIEGLQV
jgi:hypothetical protein